ncbi:MAG: tRNA pseudouridine(55) synthase TruB [Candidatus Methylomirabilales bacterium]
MSRGTVNTRGREPCGVLNVHKPEGITSHDVVDAVRRLYRIRRVGHTGTLDPRGTGVLPICVGQATKIAQYLTTADKEYEMVMRLGITTDTQDADGQVLSATEVAQVSRRDLEEILPRFIGEIEQVPPLFSAKKVGGERLYKRARRGEAVERRPVVVRIYDLRLTGVDLPYVGLWMHCSKGTYARTLCEDIGRTLGCGAHLHSLIRVRAGRFELKDALTLEAIESLVAEGRGDAVLTPIEDALAHLPGVRILPEATPSILHGIPLRAAQVVSFPAAVRPGALVRVLGFRRQLIALASTALGSDEFPGVDPHSAVLTPVRVFGGST